MPTSLSWADVAKARSRWAKPFFEKGILNLDDVRAALDSGVDGIVLGSHGGRQIDWGMSAFDLLPQAREIVGDKIQLYVSGGIRHSTDILKAMAMGADAVLARRAPLYGLCSYGAHGVERALRILDDEMMNELGQLGVPSFGGLPHVMVRRDELPLRSTGEETAG